MTKYEPCEEVKRIEQRYEKIIDDTEKHCKEVLTKMRAEIEKMTPTYHNPDWSITDLVPISEVLKLVDKYKAGSKVK